MSNFPPNIGGQVCQFHRRADNDVPDAAPESAIGPEPIDMIRLILLQRVRRISEPREKSPIRTRNFAPILVGRCQYTYTSGQKQKGIPPRNPFC